MQYLGTMALAAILMLSSFTSFAGNVEVKGEIVEKRNGNALEFANVTIFTPQHKIVSGTTSAEDGVFTIYTTLNGDEYLKVSFIGFRDTTIILPQAKDGRINLGKIAIDSESQALNAAVVTAKVPLVEQKLDKIVVNVSQSVMAATSNGFDLLKKSPGISVDMDGNVKLNGQTVQVWIDDRPSKLTGAQLESLLSSMSGNTIEKIEIMQHPSARYDASGSGGIINIKTKKNFIKGLYGNADFSYTINPEMNSYNSFSGSLLVNYRSKSANTQVSYSGNRSQNDVSFESESLFGNNFSLKQKNVSDLATENTGHYIKVGSDIYPNKKNTFGFLANINIDNGSYYSKSPAATEITNNGTLIQTTRHHISQPNSFSGLDANLYYIHSFGGVKELTLNADYGYYDTGEEGFQRIINIPLSRAAGKSAYSTDNSRYMNILSFKADYKCMPFKNAMLEAGAKIESTHTNNRSVRMDSTNAGPQYNPELSSFFKYRETIGAAYGSLSYQFNRKWSAVFGLRAEYTHTNGDWISANEKSSSNNLSLFPTLYVGFTPKNWRFSLSYTRRISRPSYSQLNPALYIVDATTTITGDPSIKPNYSNSLALMAGYRSYLNVGFVFNSTNDYITQLAEFDQETGNRTIIWGNYGTQTFAGAAISITELPLAKDLLYLSVNSFMSNLYNKKSGASTATNQFFHQHYGTLTTLLPRNWKVELIGFYMNGGNFGDLNIKSFYSINAGIKKELWEKKVTLSLSANDIFRTSRMKVSQEDNTNIYHLYQNQFRQSIRFGIKVNFGKIQSGRKNLKREGTSQRVGGSESGTGMGGLM